MVPRIELEVIEGQIYLQHFNFVVNPQGMGWVSMTPDIARALAQKLSEVAYQAEHKDKFPMQGNFVVLKIDSTPASDPTAIPSGSGVATIKLSE